MPSCLRPVLWSQHGALTVAQLEGAGTSRGQRRTLLANGWTSPVRGVLVEPEPRDAFRASVSAALLARPAAAACRVTAARLHELWLPTRWTPCELPEVAVAPRANAARCRGMLTYAGLAGQVAVRHRLRVTGLDRTVRDLSTWLAPDDLVCLVDSALRLGWKPRDVPVRSRLARALRLADRRSESALETLFRLLFVRAGVAPEDLQHRLVRPGGDCYARLDLAWPSRRVAVEVDGRQFHDDPAPAYRDRAKQNRAGIDGWIVLRVTWADLRDAPGLVIAQVQEVLAGRMR